MYHHAFKFDKILQKCYLLIQTVNFNHDGYFDDGWLKVIVFSDC